MGMEVGTICVRSSWNSMGPSSTGSDPPSPMCSEALYLLDSTSFCFSYPGR